MVRCEALSQVTMKQRDVAYKLVQLANGLASVKDNLHTSMQTVEGVAQGMQSLDGLDEEVKREAQAFKVRSAPGAWQPPSPRVFPSFHPLSSHTAVLFLPLPFHLLLPCRYPPFISSAPPVSSCHPPFTYNHSCLAWLFAPGPGRPMLSSPPLALSSPPRYPPRIHDPPMNDEL